MNTGVRNILGSPGPNPVVTPKRIVEYQAIILSGGDEAQLYPLLQDRQSLALLPVANRPLLYYQLKVLEKAGFSDCIVAVEEQYRKAVNEYLSRNAFKIKVELFFPKLIDDQWETGLVLKQLSALIVTDFIVISGDLVSEASIHDIVDIHRTRDATATVVLKENEPIEWKELHSSAATFSYIAVQAQDNVKTFYGLEQSGQHTADHRIVMMRASEGDSGPCLIGRNVMERCPRFVLHNNLTDCHLYVFKPWVLDLIESQSMISIKDDLLPFLVSMQWRSDFQTRYPEIYASALSSQNLAYSMTASPRSAPTLADRVRVFSFVVPYKKNGSVFISRATSLEAFGWMNFAIQDQPISEMTPWEPFHSAAPMTVSGSLDESQSDIGSLKSGTERNLKLVKSLMGERCTVHPSANLARCIVGEGCSIGASVKMRNCLVLANCKIEDGVQLENCVLASGAIIQKRSSLNKCQVGPKYVVPAGTSAENALLTNVDEDEEDDDAVF